MWGASSDWRFYHDYGKLNKENKVKKLIIQGLSFKTHVKLCTMFGCVIGVIAGIFGLISGFFGVEVISDFTNAQYEGVIAGGYLLLYLPVYFTAMGIVSGTFSYLPFKWFMKLKGNIEIEYIPIED